MELLTLSDYRRAAKAVLPASAFDYFRSGADGHSTLVRNLRAYRRVSIWPRVLVDVSKIDLTTELLGVPLVTVKTHLHRAKRRLRELMDESV